MPYNLDPELAAGAALLPASSLDDPVAARAHMAELFARLIADVDAGALAVEDRLTAEGVPVRVYAPGQRGGHLGLAAGRRAAAAARPTSTSGRLLCGW